MRNTKTTIAIRPAPMATRGRTGASATNLFILNAAPWFPVGLLLLSALIAWGRRPQIKTLAGPLTPNRTQPRRILR